MRTKFSRKLLSTVIAGGLIVEAAPVLAQQMALEEIVVTARKRDESIMKVPVTASVLSGEVMDQYGITDVKGIADRTPGLDIGSGVLSSGVLVSLRGVGTGTNNANIDQSVALVADGMQFTQGLAFKAASFDMAQVEVLKGPQALFFGKAAPAGVISIRTADPTDEAEVILRAGYEFEGDEQLGEIILSGPVSDTLSLRLAAQFSDMDGYFENNAVPSSVPFLGIPPLGDLGAAPVTYDEFPNKESLLLRGTAVWEPTEQFTARLKLNYSDVEVQGYGGDSQLNYCPEGTSSIFSPFEFIGPDCQVDDQLNTVYLDPASAPYILNGGVPFSDSQQQFGSLELNYDLGNGLTLTSVTGSYEVEQSSMIVASVTSTYGTPFAIQGQFERTDFTQELRLTSDYEGDVNFMAGAFYQDTETDYLSQLPVNLAYNDLFSFIRPGAALPPLLAWADHHVNGEAKSLFGQVLWQLAPDWELGVGARWTDEDRDHSTINELGRAFGAPSGVPVALGNPEISSTTWSPEISLAWTPSDDLTVFANLKQAYKSGGFDVGGAASDGDDKSFDDERVRGGEIGIKSRGQDGNLLVNLSAYYYEYEDMQVEVSVFDPNQGRVFVLTNNAASSEISGIDFDLTYAVPDIQGLTLYGAVNWNVAEYDKFGNAACWLGQTQSQGCNVDFDNDGIGDAQDLSGESLLMAPEWVANIGFDYETPLTDGLKLRIGSHLKYSDSYVTSAVNLPQSEQDSYTKTSATIGLISADDRWKIEVIGDNLNDELVSGKCSPTGYAHTLLFGTDQSPAGAGNGTVNGGPLGQPENACLIERGRSVWVRFTMSLL